MCEFTKWKYSFYFHGIFSNVPNTKIDTNGKSDAIEVPQRRPSSNLTELLQNANGSNPSSPLNSRQNSLFVRSQQSSFECKTDEEITNPDPKLIDQLFSNGSQTHTNGTKKEAMEVDTNKVNDESKYEISERSMMTISNFVYQDI